MKKKYKIIDVAIGIIMACMIIGGLVYLGASVSQFANELEANTTNATVSMEPLCAFKGTASTLLTTTDVCYLVCKRAEKNDYYLLTFPANSPRDYTPEWKIASGSESFDLTVKRTPFKVDVAYKGLPISIKSITEEDADAYIASNGKIAFK